jgi:hypothetical protein
MVISLIPHLHGHIFEGARVWGNFYLNCWNEKLNGKEKKGKKIAKKNRVNQYLHLLLVTPLIDPINLKNVRFELRDPTLLLAWDIYNIQK